MSMRKTKIVCTLGPASENREVLRELMLAGMDVARFNFSHGSQQEHLAKLNLVQELREELNLPVATLLDTRGPEIRVCQFQDGKVELENGQDFTLWAQDRMGDATGVALTYKELAGDVSVGDTILLDDGLIELKVKAIQGKDLICTVCNGGTLSNNKGVNVPNAHLSMPFISERDRSDLIFGMEHDFDFIAASFTRSAQDILEIRSLCQEHHCDHINIIAKIENMEGVENIDEIIRVSDGIMVARGDMGVEIPLEDVPVLQKIMIKKAYRAGKVVITATQMLDSMMKNPRPTRAEATDVANAIYDGTSAIMLSGETAAGKYPVQAVQTMARIARRTEEDIDYIKRFKQQEEVHSPDVTSAISHATCTTAHDLKAAAIVTITKSGRTARMVSKYRPQCPVVACTTSQKVRRQLNLAWGVLPLYLEELDTTDELFDRAVDCAQQAGVVKSGELVVITAGVPVGVSGTTNLMKVQVAGHILLTGKGITGRAIQGPLCVCKTVEDAKKNFQDGDILVVPSSNNDLLPYIKRSSGLIVEEGGMHSHGAIVGLTLDLPVIVGAEHATEVLKSGAVILLDSQQGIVACNEI